MYLVFFNKIYYLSKKNFGHGLSLAKVLLMIFCGFYSNYMHSLLGMFLNHFGRKTQFIVAFTFVIAIFKCQVLNVILS